MEASFLFASCSYLWRPAKLLNSSTGSPFLLQAAESECSFSNTYRTSLIIPSSETPALTARCFLLTGLGLNPMGPFLWIQRHKHLSSSTSSSDIHISALFGPSFNFFFKFCILVISTSILCFLSPRRGSCSYNYYHHDTLDFSFYFFSYVVNNPLYYILSLS